MSNLLAADKGSYLFAGQLFPLRVNEAFIRLSKRHTIISLRLRITRRNVVFNPDHTITRAIQFLMIHLHCQTLRDVGNAGAWVIQKLRNDYNKVPATNVVDAKPTKTNKRWMPAILNHLVGDLVTACLFDKLRFCLVPQRKGRRGVFP